MWKTWEPTEYVKSKRETWKVLGTEPAGNTKLLVKLCDILAYFPLSALLFDDVSVLWIVLIWIISNALVFHLNKI